MVYSSLDIWIFNNSLRGKTMKPANMNTRFVCAGSNKGGVLCLPKHKSCLLAALTLLALAGCAAAPPAIESESLIESSLLTGAIPTHEAVTKALQSGQIKTARDMAQRLVLNEPRNGSAHLLLAAAYHLNGDPSGIELAASGYGAARQVGGQNGWSNYLSGVAALQTDRPQQAMDHFARAVIARPDHLWSLEGLAASAYMSGEVGIAYAAAARALAIDATSVPAWRIAALSRAAIGDRAGAEMLMSAKPAQLDALQLQQVRDRVFNLVRTAAVDGKAGTPTAGTTAPISSQVIPHPNQVSVDVTLILADDRHSSANGINLMDGLQIQFGGDRKLVVSRSSTANETYQSTLTRSIKMPDITYNLNLFNRGARYYDVIARPTLTAFNGQQSTFFVGEQLFVQVSGVNSSQLEKIDVGISVKLTPSDITAEGAKFKIEADRSFFSDQAIGSFKEQLATFKQSVSATAEVKFGETLVLSGLSEKLQDGNSSRTPILGDIPVTNAVFKRSTRVERTRSVLVLVTPSQSQGVARGPQRSKAVEQLLELWDRIVEPNHGPVPLLKRLISEMVFTRAEPSDIVIRDLKNRQVLESFVADLGRKNES
jgi:Tfp pilus assembly protein PilF